MDEPGRPDFEASVPARQPTTPMAAVFDNRSGYSTGMAIANPTHPIDPIERYAQQCRRPFF